MSDAGGRRTGPGAQDKRQYEGHPEIGFTESHSTHTFRGRVSNANLDRDY